MIHDELAAICKIQLANYGILLQFLFNNIRVNFAVFVTLRRSTTIITLITLRLKVVLLIFLLHICN